MIALGFGEIFGGLFVGKIRDTYKNIAAIAAQIVILLAALIYIQIFNSNNDFTYTGAYLMCFLWGTQDSGINCFVNCILGFEFESKILPFSVFKFTQSLFTFVFFIVQSHVVNDDLELDDQINILKIYLMIVGIFGILSVSLMLIFDFKKENDKKDEGDGGNISKVESEEYS